MYVYLCTGILVCLCTCVFGYFGTLGSTFVHLCPHGSTWVPVFPLGFMWVHLAQLGFLGCHIGQLGALGSTWVLLGPHGFHMGSLGFTLVYLCSLGFSCFTQAFQLWGVPTPSWREVSLNSNPVFQFSRSFTWIFPLRWRDLCHKNIQSRVE